MSKGQIVLASILGVLIVVVLFFQAPNIHRFFNNWRFGIQEAHDQTDYATLRRVEDTARAMVASFEADRLQWEQFRDSDVQEERNWANGAMMRANRTASSFNNFMRENSFVWAYGIPSDIDFRMEYLRNP